MLTKGLYNVNMQKGTVLHLLLISLVLVGGIFGYWYLNKGSKTNIQNPNTKSSKIDQLKTYTSSSLGFELEYSKEFTVLEDSEENFNQRGNGDFRKNFKGYVGYEPGKFLGAVVLLKKANSLDEVASSAYDQNPFTVWVFDNPEDLNIDKWYGNFWYYPFVWGDFTYTGKSTLAPKEDATVSGQLGKFGIIDYQPGKPRFIYLSKDKKMYLFRIIEETGDQILSTFKFLSTDQTEGDKDCKRIGCSGQVCSDENVITTCEYKEEYGCYTKAKCERQLDGKCGWTQTEDLTECLQEKKDISPDVLQ